MANRVKNKSPAPIQITSEQILREARERHEPQILPPKHTITDSTELADYRQRKRKHFEDEVCTTNNKNGWVKYAKWEAQQKDFKRARSVWERALHIDYKDHTLWLEYASAEMKNKCIDHSRNVWERAVTLLPRVDQLWYKYIHMEEMLGNVAGARHIFERWMTWNPDQQAWISYIKFELKYNEIERARAIYERLKQNCKENEGIEDALVRKTRMQYEQQVGKNPLQYDSWFELIRLEESVGDKVKIREVYERAVANVPPAADDKRHWERYIYLWVNFALFEELDAQDVVKTRDVYRRCLKLIGYKKLSFAKIWLLAAQFEIRQLNLSGARLILGNAIGTAPKDKIFNKYIQVELQLGNIERCRKLYEKHLEWAPENCYAWRDYVQLEISLRETERARAIFELAIAQPALDMPELLWKAYIDFEIAEGEFERARQVYSRLLDRTKHLKMWISYAKFEASAIQEAEQQQEQRKLGIRRARRVFENAINYYRTSAPELKEERAMLLEEWLNMETGFGELGDVELVRVKLPKKLKKIRQTESGAGYEEYIDYLFPEELETRASSSSKILEKAYTWKAQKGGDDEDD